MRVDDLPQKRFEVLRCNVVFLEGSLTRAKNRSTGDMGAISLQYATKSWYVTLRGFSFCSWLLRDASWVVMRSNRGRLKKRGNPHMAVVMLWKWSTVSAAPENIDSISCMLSAFVVGGFTGK